MHVKGELRIRAIQQVVNGNLPKRKEQTRRMSAMLPNVKGDVNYKNNRNCFACIVAGIHVLW